MNKWFWVILALAVAGMIGIFVVSNSKDSAQNSTNNQDPAQISEADHIRGNKDAKVTLVEYGDFQCPACGAFYPIIKQVEADYGEKVKFVFRHFPLTDLHPNAFSAARAAEAAGSQNKFFEMHDLLYERQSTWEKETNVQKIFREYAQEIGLDANRFNDDYASNSTTDRINSSVQKGKNQNVQATPTFYLNNQKLENFRTYEELKAKLDEALKNAG